MSKSPAFSFYYRDFSHGTRMFTFYEKGAYIELLCEQADVGHLSLEYIKKILKDSFPIWETISQKFSVDEEGLYFNKVLDEHLKSRKKFVESRKKNLMGSQVDVHKGSQVVDLMANANANSKCKRKSNKDKVFRKPTLEQVKKYCIERKSSVDPETFFHHYESSGWVKANGQKVKNWKSTIITWENNSIKKGETNPPKMAYHHLVSQPEENELITDDQRKNIRNLIKQTMDKIK